MTAIDICNMALSDIGHDRHITSFETAGDRSKEAQRCALAWPRARRDVASCFAWSFLTVDMPAVELPAAQAAQLLIPGHNHAYAAPADAMRIVALVSSDGTKVAYVMRGGIIHAQDPATRILYTVDSEQPDDWPQPFVDAVVAAVAARIARPLTGDEKVISRTALEYANALRAAKMHDSSAFSSAPGTKNPYKDARA